MFQQTPAGERRKTAVTCAAETGGGKEGVSWKNVENDGIRSICTWDVGNFLQEISRVKRFRELADEEKTGRKKRSMAAGIASQRVPGTSEMLP